MLNYNKYRTVNEKLFRPLNFTKIIKNACGKKPGNLSNFKCKRFLSVIVYKMHKKYIYKKANLKKSIYFYQIDSYNDIHKDKLIDVLLALSLFVIKLQSITREFKTYYSQK